MSKGTYRCPDCGTTVGYGDKRCPNSSCQKTIEWGRLTTFSAKPSNPNYYFSIRVRSVLGGVMGIFLGSLSVTWPGREYFLLFVLLGFLMGFCLPHYLAVWRERNMSPNEPPGTGGSGCS